MENVQSSVVGMDPVWDRLINEAHEAVENEPLLGGVVHSCVLHHSSIEEALAYRIATKLASSEMSEQILREICDEAYAADTSLAMAARADIVAVYERDPSCHRFLQPLLYFKGFQAVQAYRIAHWLWQQGRNDMAQMFQMRISEMFGVDIHPGAKIGQGIMIDHAHSIVIGETAVVGNNVSMLHAVTLGICLKSSCVCRSFFDDFKNSNSNSLMFLLAFGTINCPATNAPIEMIEAATKNGRKYL